MGGSRASPKNTLYEVFLEWTAAVDALVLEMLAKGMTRLALSEVL